MFVELRKAAIARPLNRVESCQIHVFQLACSGYNVDRTGNDVTLLKLNTLGQRCHKSQHRLHRAKFTTV